ncbi:MAG TPA: hypothetical protein V6D12_03735 [Candidatus Obscuribacterales bacterium]
MRNYRQSALLGFTLLATLWGASAYGKQVIDLGQSLESSQSVIQLAKSQAKAGDPSSDCTYDDRKTVNTVKNQKGKITLSGGIYVLVTEGTNSIRLGACNLPDAFKKEGQSVLFSGEVKEIYPNERWAATPFKITTIKNLAAPNTPAPVKSSLQRLPNGKYKVCSEPPSTTAGKDNNLITGYCFAFRKSGSRVIGTYYDTKTLGEEAVCMSGTLNNSAVRGEAIEEIGSVGRQKTPPNSSGSQLVNWDKEGYLKVARARVVRTYGAPLYYKTVRYGSSLLNLNSFYRHSAGTIVAPSKCLN